LVIGIWSLVIWFRHGSLVIGIWSLVIWFRYMVRLLRTRVYSISLPIRPGGLTRLVTSGQIIRNPATEVQGRQVFAPAKILVWAVKKSEVGCQRSELSDGLLRMG